MLQEMMYVYHFFVNMIFKKKKNTILDPYWLQLDTLKTSVVVLLLLL